MDIRSVIRPVMTNPGMAIHRPSILGPPPRGLFTGHGMHHDGRFYRPHMRDHHGYAMNMTPTPGYGYNPHIRPPMSFHDPYAFMGRPNQMPRGQYPRPNTYGTNNYNELVHRGNLHFANYSNDTKYMFVIALTFYSFFSK